MPGKFFVAGGLQHQDGASHGAARYLVTNSSYFFAQLQRVSTLLFMVDLLVSAGWVW